MTDCIFCKIVERKIPAEIVYEDKDFLAFLDIHPQSPGHVQVIPKTHYRWVWNVPNIGQYFEVVQKIALAQQAAFGVKAIWSKVMGDEVAHAHVWIFPGLKEPLAANSSDLAGNALKIRRALA